MGKGPLRATDKRRAGYSDNMTVSVERPKRKGGHGRNGTSHASSNEFQAGRNGQSKRSL